MNILFFNNTGLTIDGEDYCVETKTGNFAKELQKKGHNIIFFGQYIPPTKNTVHVFKIKENGMRVIGRNRINNKFFNYFLLYFKTIPAILRSDFVYVFYPNSFKYVLLFSKLIGKKYGLYIRGENSIDSIYSKYIYRSAHSINTVSDKFSQLINKSINKQIAKTIKPMIDFSFADVVENRDYTKSKEYYEILYLGRLSFDKGLEELVLAISKLVNRKLRIHLKIVGAGSFYDKLQKQCLDLNLTEHISFEGAVYDSKQIENYYRNADIFVLPTYHEGFPRTLYEAMIFGTPIITTFVGGIPALMKDGFNCKKIIPKSVDSIVDALDFGIHNYDTMIAFAKQGTETVKSILDSKKSSHEKLLDQSLNGVKSPKKS